MIATLLCLIVGISDGDTLTARCGQYGAYEQVKVRLSAIDAPESDQDFWQVSRQHLANLCFRQMASITPKTKDRYGRTVADVECRGKDAGQAQVSAGLAWVYKDYAKGYEHLYPLERYARLQGRGLWVMTDPVGRGCGERPSAKTRGFNERNIPISESAPSGRRVGQSRAHRLCGQHVHRRRDCSGCAAWLRNHAGAGQGHGARQSAWHKARLLHKLAALG